MALARGLVRHADGVPRCWWADGDPLYLPYHDDEWGRPVTDDNRLFEKICLEGFQAGLSWLTILRKRQAFRRAFAGFDIARVARFGGRDVDRLLRDAGIVRHRGKIESTINNAERNKVLNGFQLRQIPTVADSGRTIILLSAALLTLHLARRAGHARRSKSCS